MEKIMQPPIRLSQTIQKLLCCPKCHDELKKIDDKLECINSKCATCFPVVNGVPVLINEQSSIFSIDDFISFRNTFFNNLNESRLKKNLRLLIPNISNNIKAKANYCRLSEMLLAQSTSVRVLVIGGSILGQGMEYFTKNTAIDLVESDISFGPRTMLICDAHDIPFPDNSFDGVIAQAVLEHVVDPYRCCEEIYRVLKKNGVVYAETPFMQQIHGGRYDFTRFTYLGHRRLFRKFEEIDSGALCGPGMALAWAYQYFLMSFTTSRILKILVRFFAKLTSFYLKYLDYYLINKPGTLDAASAYYFMGRKVEQILPDRDLIKLYKGLADS
jgi:SAM-dependent methyltransferase